MTLASGTTIVFHNRDDIPHTVVGSTATDIKKIFIYRSGRQHWPFLQTGRKWPLKYLLALEKRGQIDIPTMDRIMATHLIPSAALRFPAPAANIGAPGETSRAQKR